MKTQKATARMKVLLNMKLRTVNTPKIRKP